jgi:hypothetical protein
MLFRFVYQIFQAIDRLFESKTNLSLFVFSKDIVIVLHIDTALLLFLDSADKLIHPRVTAFVKPDVRLGLFSLGEFHALAAPRLRDRSREVFDAEGDHVAQVALGADVGEVVRHGVKVG